MPMNDGTVVEEVVVEKRKKRRGGRKWGKGKQQAATNEADSVESVECPTDIVEM